MRIKWFSLIRITGLLLVLLYHFFQTIFPGGFFGVDVFFTFSGFLITSLLLEEFGKARQIDLLGFFKRYFVKQHGHIAEYYTIDKTALRSVLYGRIEDIIEVQ